MNSVCDVNALTFCGNAFIPILLFIRKDRWKFSCLFGRLFAGWMEERFHSLGNLAVIFCMLCPPHKLVNSKLLKDFKNNMSAPASVPTPIPPVAKTSDFLNRTVFTLIMAFSFLIMVGYGAGLLVPLTLLVMMLMFHEVLRINQKDRKDRQMPYFKYLPWYFYTVTQFVTTLYFLRDPIVATWPILAEAYHAFGIGSFGLYMFGFVAFVLSLKKGLYRYQFGQFTWMAMTLIFIVVQGTLQMSNMFRGIIWFVLPVTCVIQNDIWAYACGKMYGRTKLLRLSPKKTVEGFLGAWIVTTYWGFWFSGFLSRFPRFVCPKMDFGSSVTCEIDPIFLHVVTPLPSWVQSATLGYFTTIELAPIQRHALVIAAFASLLAPFGGFFASGLKRAFKLKDFGALIPGHGGMTDRMDCQIIMGLFTFVYVHTFVFAKQVCPSTADVLGCIQRLPLEAQHHIVQQIQASWPHKAA